jgi:hypothetical protein
MDGRTERLAENEALFRSINELIEQAATEQGADEHVFEFLCECSNSDCTLFVPLTVAEYEEVRADPTQFLVKRGHVVGDVETVVAERRRYLVVRKIGEAAEYVGQRDPRRL